MSRRNATGHKSRPAFTLTAILALAVAQFHVPDSLKTFLRTQLGLSDGQVGMILLIHTFGEYLGWHPHLHILCADGLFRQSGLFYCMRPVDLQELEQLFRDRVLKFLVQAGKIAQATADQISAWPHTVALESITAA